MAKPKVFATHSLFEAARQILQETCEVEYWAKPERPPREEVLQRVKDKEGLICLLTEKVNEELLKAAPKLRIAANVAVGFDNIDVAACTKRNVAATNTPGVLDETTADFAWTLMMAVARRLSEGEALARSGNWKHWDLDQLVGTDVWGKTLGIVGFGRIGRAVARRASGFQMKVVYTDAVRAPAGAGLDVYESEPFISPGLKRANVVLAPHIASASLETRTKMACIAAENVVALFAGKRPPNILNLEVLTTS